MERLTYDFALGGNHCWQVKGADNLECREVCERQGDDGCKTCPIAKTFDRLAAIEDILGDEYDLERLKFIMDAERHGGLIVRYPRDDPGPKGPPRCLPRLREIRGDILGRKNRRIYLCFVRLVQYRGRTTEGAGWLIGRS